MVMGVLPVLVIIDIINVFSVTFGKPENHSPVGSNGHCPESFHLAFERMQPKTGHVHMGHGWSSVKRSQNIAQLGDMLLVYAARVVMLKKPSQALVANAPYHHDNVMRHVADVK